jgi:hypothetical protein
MTQLQVQYSALVRGNRFIGTRLRCSPIWHARPMTDERATPEQLATIDELPTVYGLKYTAGLSLAPGGSPI